MPSGDRRQYTAHEGGHASTLPGCEWNAQLGRTDARVLEVAAELRHPVGETADARMRSVKPARGPRLFGRQKQQPRNHSDGGVKRQSVVTGANLDQATTPALRP
jgi:hypothetical protein